MKKKIIVACGGAVATSTIAADRVRALCKDNGIDAEVSQCRISELGSQTDADLFVTTAKISRDYGVPVVHGLAFISGLNLPQTEAQILEILGK